VGDVCVYVSGWVCCGVGGECNWLRECSRVTACWCRCIGGGEGGVHDVNHVDWETCPTPYPTHTNTLQPLPPPTPPHTWEALQVRSIAERIPGGITSRAPALASSGCALSREGSQGRRWACWRATHSRLMVDMLNRRSSHHLVRGFSTRSRVWRTLRGEGVCV
jgi:hypothetical protein